MKNSSGERGISTAGHCGGRQTDDGSILHFEDEHEGTRGDLQWHTGLETVTDDFYAGSKSSLEANRRDVSSIGCTVVGQTLCRNGMVSYIDCQEVRKLNVCHGDYCNLVQMGARLSAGGDSGGPVYWENEAHGLHQGWMYDPVKPFKRDLFSRADRMGKALDTHVAMD